MPTDMACGALPERHVMIGCCVGNLDSFLELVNVLLLDNKDDFEDGSLF